MNKRWLSLLLALVLVVTAAPALAIPAQAEDWEDIGPHSAWAEEELRRAEEADLLPDCLEEVDLTQNITRAEFAAVAVELYEELGGRDAPRVTENPFTDTDDEEVMEAYALKIVDGVGEGKFDPQGLLTREQACTMLNRAYLRAKPDAQLWYTTPAAYQDDSSISTWARDSVYFMTAYGVLGGMGDGTFAPQSSATREQGLCIALRALENLPD